jgi:hypothetical protein
MVDQIRGERARYTRAGTTGKTTKVLKVRENESRWVSIAGEAAASVGITANEALMLNQHSKHPFRLEDTIEVSDSESDE